MAGKNAFFKSCRFHSPCNTLWSPQQKIHWWKSEKGGTWCLKPLHDALWVVIIGKIEPGTFRNAIFIQSIYSDSICFDWAIKLTINPQCIVHEMMHTNGSCLYLLKWITQWNDACATLEKIKKNFLRENWFCKIEFVLVCDEPRNKNFLNGFFSPLTQ